MNTSLNCLFGLSEEYQSLTRKKMCDLKNYVELIRQQPTPLSFTNNVQWQPHSVVVMFFVYKILKKHRLTLKLLGKFLQKYISDSSKNYRC